MNVAQRLYLIAAIAIGVGGVIYAKTALDLANAKSNVGLATSALKLSTAQMNVQLAQMQNDSVALARARESHRIASMSADERFQGQRYFAYGLMGVGALFGLVGFVVSGARGGAGAPAKAVDAP